MTEFAHDTIVPFEDSALSKKDQVAGMFNQIAGKYDFLNRLLSVGIDVYWRKKGLQQLSSISPDRILDVATGTADVAIMAAKMLRPTSIVGMDISSGMLDIAQKKIQEKGLSQTIQLKLADSEAMPFDDNQFDAVTVAFGVRNFQDLRKGLSEIRRVLKPGGKLMVLEFSKPRFPLVKWIYTFYMKIVTPNLGKLFSKNKAAYTYLDKSIQQFPEGKNFIKILQEIGYQQTEHKSLSAGICSIYCGIK